VLRTVARDQVVVAVDPNRRLPVAREHVARHEVAVRALLQADPGLVGGERSAHDPVAAGPEALEAAERVARTGRVGDHVATGRDQDEPGAGVVAGDVELEPVAVRAVLQLNPTPEAARHGQADQGVAVGGVEQHAVAELL
jgi:hypothetical protein